jgi:RNA polymerase sigma-70 factor (ECF subfamily)
MGVANAMTGADLLGSRAAPREPDHDAELMLRVRAGESACFGLLVDRYRNPLVHFLYRMVQNQPVAEELAQEVLVRIYRTRETYEPSARFSTWLFRIATNLALNHIRDNKGEKGQTSLDEQVGDGGARQVRDDRATVEERMVREARLAEVRQAIEKLPEKQRAAVLMHKYQEMDYHSISRALDCSEPALKSLLFRAYETLRVRLAHLNT